MPDIPRLNLQGVQFVAPTITPIAYQFKPTDISILERSLAQREARMKESTQLQSNMNTALGKLEATLHNDPETNQWFANYKANIQRQIQDEIEAGNYGSAIRTATRLAGESAQDSGLIGRVQANIDYEKAVETQRQRLAKGEIDNRIFNWWLEKNPYQYNAAFDSSGNEVRGKLADIKAPEAKLSFEQLWITAAKMVEEEAGSYSTGTTNTNKPLNLLEQQAGTPSTVGTSSADSYHRKTTARIQEVYNNLLNNPTIQAQLMQEFEVAKWDYEKLQEELLDPNIDDKRRQTITTAIEEYTPMLQRNGSPITNYKEWLDKNNNQSPYARSLAYDRRTHQDETQNGWADTPGSGGRSPKGDDSRYTPTNYTGGGANVEQKQDASTAKANAAAASVAEIMGEASNIQEAVPASNSFVLPAQKIPTI